MKILKPREVAKRLNVSVATIQRWSNEGKIKEYRTITNRRYYILDEIEEFEKYYLSIGKYLS